jgi:UDP-glucose 4-epimerase
MKNHKKKNKIFFVTGAMGFIGTHWCKKLLSKGHIVLGLDIKNNTIKHKNFKYYKNSVFEFKILEKIIKKSDVVCHFAGIAEQKLYLTNTTKVINLTVKPSFRIVELCVKYGKKILFTSTSEIYGKSTRVPFNEDDDRLFGSTNHSRWCYSTSKSLVEHLIIANGSEKKLDYVIFRLFNVFGPGLKGTVVDEFIKNAINQKPILINGNGKQIRSFLFVEDCIEAFYGIYKKKINKEIFNIGQKKETTIKDLAKIIIKITGSKSKLILKSNQLTKYKGYQDIERIVPDNKKLKTKINWKPIYSIEYGIRSMIADLTK